MLNNIEALTRRLPERGTDSERVLPVLQTKKQNPFACTLSCFETVLGEPNRWPEFINNTIKPYKSDYQIRDEPDGVELMQIRRNSPDAIIGEYNYLDYAHPLLIDAWRLAASALELKLAESIHIYRNEPFIGEKAIPQIKTFSRSKIKYPNLISGLESQSEKGDLVNITQKDLENQRGVGGLIDLWLQNGYRVIPLINCQNMEDLYVDYSIFTPFSANRSGEYKMIAHKPYFLHNLVIAGQIDRYYIVIDPAVTGNGDNIHEIANNYRHAGFSNLVNSIQKTPGFLHSDPYHTQPLLVGKEKLINLLAIERGRELIAVRPQKQLIQVIEEINVCRDTHHYSGLNPYSYEVKTVEYGNCDHWLRFHNAQ